MEREAKILIKNEQLLLILVGMKKRGESYANC